MFDFLGGARWGALDLIHYFRLFIKILTILKSRKCEDALKTLSLGSQVKKWSLQSCVFFEILFIFFKIVYAFERSHDCITKKINLASCRLNYLVKNRFNKYNYRDNLMMCSIGSLRILLSVCSNVKMKSG